MIEGGARAVFLDRDGVVLEDRGLVVDPGDVQAVNGASAALARLARAGFELVVVTNQAVVARGLATEAQVDEINSVVAEGFRGEGVPIRAFYVCPHHPNADLDQYRVECDCRKPRPGLLLRAADDLGLDIANSFMIGDRQTDVEAGARAGCQTVLVRTGAHVDPRIETVDPIDPGVNADYTCDTLPEAVDWILAR